MALNVNCSNCGSGLLKKLNLVKELIDEKKIDIFYVAEAKVRLDYDLGCLSHKGYSLYTANTLQSRGKSRIICWVQEGFKKIDLGSKMNDIIAIEWVFIAVLSVMTGRQRDLTFGDC